MPIEQEYEMLKSNLAIIKRKMGKATTKRELLLLKDQLHTTRMELAMCQADMRNGYSLSESDTLTDDT